MHSVRETLERPWVLGIDASIKPLYGRQQGAEIGYNPAKPMRPSHVLHTFLVSNLRLVLDVQVSSGKQHTSGHAKAALGRLLDELGDKRPALVRGDSGYGNEGILLTLEERNQPYLLRLRQTTNVQRLVAQQFARQDWSRPDNQGCQMVEAQLLLHGWSKKRRVVIVRQRIRGGIARERRMDGKQLRLDLAGPSVHEGERLWEYAVLVTDVAYPLVGLGGVLVELGEYDEALALLERALAIRTRKDVDPVDLGELRFALARAVAPVDRDRALVLASEARSDYSDSGDADTVQVINTWLKGQLKRER